MEKTIKDIRQCPLYGGKYYADVEGHIYLDAKGEKEVGVYVNSSGHLRATTIPVACVHRVVYYAFHPDAPVKGYDVHHLNEDKTDNRLENLQLLTHSEHTSLHSTGEKHPMYGRTGEKNPMHGRTGEKNSCSKPVLQYTKEGVFMAEYPCIYEASCAIGANQSNISKACLHKRNSAGGFIWRFKDDPSHPRT